MIDWTLTCASTQVQPCDRLVGRGGLELGDGLGALGDGVLRELAGEHEPDRSLDLAGRERLLLGVAAELTGTGAIGSKLFTFFGGRSALGLAPG